MQLRLYPNQRQKEIIDTIIYEVGKFCNIAIYDMFQNLKNVTEKCDKNDPSKTVHFPDLISVTQKSYLNEIREQRDNMNFVPANALSGKHGAIHTDLKKRLQSQVKGDSKSLRPVEHSKPVYYSKAHPRTSYTYQETLGKFQFNTENYNVVYLKLNKLGIVKARGFKGYYENLRFDPSGTMTFIDYCEINRKKAVDFKIKKDNCNDYFVSIVLKDVYKYVEVSDELKHIGIDVGVETLMTLSNGTKYENPRFKNGMYGEIRQHRECLNRQLARREGWANIKFRNNAKELRKNDIEPVISKNYEETKLKKAKLERTVARKRKKHMENMVLEVVREADFIGIENLSLTDMFVRRDKSDAKMINKRKKAINDSLSDAAMGEILSLLKRKCDEYEVIIQEIGRYDKSSQTCSCCGYINKKTKDLNLRKWICPECGAIHDRDVNAAINILNMAMKKN